MKKRVLKDGESIVVPLVMMDGTPSPRSSTTLTDAHGHPAGRAPGYVFHASDVSDVTRENAYERRKGALVAAWCSP